jgi:hypothetical protein
LPKKTIGAKEDRGKTILPRKSKDTHLNTVSFVFIGNQAEVTFFSFWPKPGSYHMGAGFF